MNPSVVARAQAFLKVSDQFRLGDLVTESPHPSTRTLSSLCQADLPAATQLFCDIERDALAVLLPLADRAAELADVIRRTWVNGHRVYLSGCGATGRLALVLESLHKQAASQLDATIPAEAVTAFTAGGDYALVRSLGVFEDQPELGGQHLLDLGFGEGDLLIALTEGGETPFVLGTLDAALARSAESPWLFFCNPAGLLSRLVERSRQAIENPRIRAQAIEVAPMALTGSTRLQASSVLMALVGAALEEARSSYKSAWILSELHDRVAQLDPRNLAPLIEIEASAHARGRFTLHRSQTAAIAVLTDTTERSPTFSLAPFENIHDPKAVPAKTYLEIPNTSDAESAWRRLLGRAPRPFRVPSGFSSLLGVALPDVSLTGCYGFNFSAGAEARRRQAGASADTVLTVEINGKDLHFTASGSRQAASRWVGSASPLINQVLVKLALNTQSTLAMGRISRFHGNLMTYVRPSNGKLVDRALRTIRAMAYDDPSLAWIQATWDDEPLLAALFGAADRVSADEPVVLAALESLRRR